MANGDAPPMQSLSITLDGLAGSFQQMQMGGQGMQRLVNLLTTYALSDCQYFAAHDCFVSYFSVFLSSLPQRLVTCMLPACHLSLCCQAMRLIHTSRTPASMYDEMHVQDMRPL